MLARPVRPGAPMLAPTADHDQARPRSLRRAVFAVLAAAAAACSAPGVRPVVGVEPVPASYTYVERGDASPFAPDAALVADQGPVPRALQYELDLFSPGARGTAPDAGLPVRPLRPMQLDPRRGPVDLGIPVLLDMGAGDAPHDDGVQPLHADEIGRSGFSGTVIQLSWRRPLDEAVTVVGGAAFLRFQDIGLLDGIADARFGFAVLGIQLQL